MMKKDYAEEERHDLPKLFHDPWLARRDNGKPLDGLARWLVTDKVPKTDG